MATDAPYYPKIYYSKAVEPNSWYIMKPDAIWKATYGSTIYEAEDKDPLRAAIDAAVSLLAMN